MEVTPPSKFDEWIAQKNDGVCGKMVSPPSNMLKESRQREMET